MTSFDDKSHPALKDLDYYWRFEPGTEYICPIQFDAFEFMFDHNKKLSFSMALYEYEETIPTLFKTATEFAAKHPEWVQPADKDNSLWRFIIDGETNGYNRCHFWSNFQVFLVRWIVLPSPTLLSHSHVDRRSQFL